MDETLDLAIRDGRLQPAGANTAGLPARDATGLIAAPGFWDIHVHFRDPGNPLAETTGSGARAAAAGGFTHVVPMPNTTPPGDSAQWLQEQLAPRDLPVTILPAASITAERAGKALSDLETLAEHGACAFSDDGSTVGSDELMREAMRRAKALGKPILDHAVNATQAGRGVIRKGPLSHALNLPVFPPEAETSIIARDIRLCAATQCRVVIQHISTAGGVALIRDAQARKIPISAEASPHHLALTVMDIQSNNGNLCMNPPLGTPEDRAAIRAAVLDGTISLFATDHAPHAQAQKAKGFPEAPFGVIGLETAIGVTWQAMVIQERMPLIDWVSRWTVGPAAALGMPPPTLAPETPANLVLIDPKANWTVDPTRFQSRARNCPFTGQALPARAILTIHNGNISSR